MCCSSSTVGTELRPIQVGLVNDVVQRVIPRIHILGRSPGETVWVTGAGADELIAAGYLERDEG